MEKEVDRGRSLVPAVDISEDREKVFIRVEMPGVANDGVEIRVENNTLSITGKQTSGLPSGNFILRERRSGDYVKRFTLDNSVNAEKIDAAMKNGILTLILNQKESAKPKKIEIRTM
jgi:HSP20 family protein